LHSILTKFFFFFILCVAHASCIHCQSSGQDSHQGGENNQGEVFVQEGEKTDTIEEEGPYPKDQYPPAPKWDDQDPDEVQQEPPVDPTYYCRFCLRMPCLFLP
jgi:hypothetical protein